MKKELLKALTAAMAISLLTVPLSGSAEETAPADPIITETEPTEPSVPEDKTETVLLRARDQLLTDADGTTYHLNGEERRTGLFRLEPNFLMGDANRDASVDASDAALILTASANAGAGSDSAESFILSEGGTSFPDSEEALVFSDVNEDGRINASDAASILVYSAAIGAGSDPLPLGTHTYYADENG